MFFNEVSFKENNKIKIEILKLEELINKLKEAKNYFRNKELNIEEKNLLNKVEIAYDKNMFKLFKILKENNISKENIKIKLEKENINDWFYNFNNLEECREVKKENNITEKKSKKESILKEYFN